MGTGAAWRAGRVLIPALASVILEHWTCKLAASIGGNIGKETLDWLKQKYEANRARNAASKIAEDITNVLDAGLGSDIKTGQAHEVHSNLELLINTFLNEGKATRTELDRNSILHEF